MKAETVLEIIDLGCDKELYETDNELIKHSNEPIRWMVFNESGNGKMIIDNICQINFEKIEITGFDGKLYLKFVNDENYVVNIISNDEFDDIYFLM